MMFENKHIVVGISGGIAAFKAAGLVSQLRQKGADVHCIMTANAAKLVTPITFGELSGNDVTVDMFANISKWDVEHIALAQLADLFVVAPATADIIGKVANGIALDHHHGDKSESPLRTVHEYKHVRKSHRAGEYGKAEILRL